jgi:hypothetical protein
MGMRDRFDDTPIVSFHKIAPGAVSPMHADKSALGSMPAAAHQYCEALRVASSYGWYIFAPRDIRLRWDGSEVFHDQDGEGDWRPLSSVVDPEMADYWDDHCPEDMQGSAPPYLSALFVPGIVQIWSGLLVSTAPDWSVLARPPANLAHSRAYSCFEGMVEADWFKPVPLFVNIRLHAVDTAIEIRRTRPLFQLQPVHRAAYTAAMSGFVEHVGLHARETGHDDGMSAADWDGLRNTVRSISPTRPHDVGRYGTEVRKRAKQAGRPA